MRKVSVLDAARFPKAGPNAEPQLNGVAICEKLSADAVRTGLANISGEPAASHQAISKLTNWISTAGPIVSRPASRRNDEPRGGRTGKAWIANA
jgi:hypothetical protein